MAQRKLWTQFQDNALRYLRQKCQIQKWSQISIKMIENYSIKDRNQKQCRDRYTNNLNPNLNSNDWDQNDELKLIECHKKFGNKWTVISQNFQGRTDSFIKNHFYSRLRKCIRKLNRFIEQEHRKKYRKLNLNIIFKLTNLVEDKLAKITQEVRQFFEKLMYNLVDFSLKTEQNIDLKEVQTFVLALNSLQTLSGTIGANRKPKRGRGHKLSHKYLISRDGTFLILQEDQLTIMKEVDFSMKSDQIIESEIDIQDDTPKDPQPISSCEKYNSKQPVLIKPNQVCPQPNLSLTQPIIQKPQQTQKFDENLRNFDSQSLSLKQMSKASTFIQKQQGQQSYDGIMQYIMENSFDYNDNILSLQRQESYEIDRLF